MIAIWTASEIAPVHSGCQKEAGTVLDDHARSRNEEPVAGRSLDDRGKDRREGGRLDCATVDGWDLGLPYFCP